MTRNLDQTEIEIGLVCQDLAVLDNTRPLVKPLLRKIFQKSWGDLDISYICVQGLMRERADFPSFDNSQKFPWINAVVEAICFAQLLSIPSSFYEGNPSKFPKKKNEFDGLPCF